MLRLQRAAVWALAITLLAVFPAAARLDARVAASVRTVTHPPSTIRSTARFERNQGQFDSTVLFAGRGLGARALFLASEVVFADDASTPVRMVLPVTTTTRVEGVDRIAARVNYFVGNRPDAWQRNVPSFERVAYRNVAPGVDVLFYENRGSLEFDVVVAPGADPGCARFEFPACTTKVDGSGDLVVTLADTTLRTHRPIAYQGGPRGRQPVAVTFDVDDHGAVGFYVGRYDPARTLTIDPPIVYSTLYGGSNSDEIDSLKVGLDGSIYACGTTFSADLPTPGGIDHDIGSKYDFFVAKFAPGGRDLMFATYLGGNNGEFFPKIAVDPSGAITVVGATFSTDYPIANALQPAPVGLLEGVVTKFAPDGASLVYSTYLGGSMNDYVNGVAMRTDGSAVISGQTVSANFPVDGASPRFGGDQEGYIAELSPDGSALAHSRYVGGSAAEFVGDVVLDRSGTAYFSFYSESPNFPGGNAVGGRPCLVSVDPAWTSVNATVVNPGVPGRINGFSLALRPGGLLFVGFRELQLTPGVRGAIRNDAIVFATDFDGNLVATHAFEGSIGDIGRSVAVDPDGRVFVVCDANSPDLPTVNAPFQPAFGGVEDVYFAELAPDTLDVIASGYFGGLDYDETNAIVSDTLGNLYIGGVTNSSNFVVTNGAYQTVIAGNGDAYLTKTLSANTSGVFELEWLPPVPGATPMPPRGLTATRAAARNATQVVPARGFIDVAGYRVYRSTAAGVEASTESFYFYVPASMTRTGPIVAGGGYFVVTAVYADGAESAPSGEVGGGVGEAAISRVTVKPKKLVIAGTGFSSAITVFVDEIPFVASAKVKHGTKVNQKGALQNGQTVAAYLDAVGGSAVLSVRNANGATATYRLVQ